MPPVPDSAAEAVRWLAIGVGVGIVAVIGIYAVNALAAMAVTVIVLVAVALVVWIVGGRLWDALRHGKPLIRGDWSGENGGEN